MAKNENTTKSPEEQEAEELAKSKAARTAGESVADVPAATSSKTKGEPKEPSASRRETFTKEALIARSGSLLGVAPWVTATALHDLSDDERMTLDRAGSLIEKSTDRGRRN